MLTQRNHAGAMQEVQVPPHLSPLAADTAPARAKIPKSRPSTWSGVDFPWKTPLNS